MTVSVKNGTYGKALMDNKDKTLYVFDKDTKNKSHCTGACAEAWPPLLTTKTPTAGSGVKSELLKTTTRSDGKKQVTYNGHPLYRFDEDKKSKRHQRAGRRRVRRQVVRHQSQGQKDHHQADEQHRLRILSDSVGDLGVLGTRAFCAWNASDCPA